MAAAAVLLAVVATAIFLAVRYAAIRSLEASCREASQAKDWRRVDELAGRWHRWDRSQALPLIYQAEAAVETKDFERAAAVLDELPDGDPRTPAALVERSSILFDALNRPIEGAESLERAVRLEPKLVEPRRRLIYFYAFTLQRKKLVHQVYDAISHDCDLPETYVYLMSRDWFSFANAYEENTRWFQGDRDEELFLVARAVYRIRTKGLDETADPADGPPAPDGTPYHRQIMIDYAKRFPHNLEILAYDLDAASSAGQVEEVARLLAQAPPAASDDNRFWRYKGWLHAARGELTEAEQCYETALSINCYDFVTRHQLAGVKRRQRRVDEVKALEELVTAGKDLRRMILQIERVDRVPPQVLKQMADYAQQCGDMAVAGKLLLRIREWSSEWSRMQPEDPPSAAPVPGSD